MGGKGFDSRLKGRRLLLVGVVVPELPFLSRSFSGGGRGDGIGEGKRAYFALGPL